jgi:hypothetical protein
MTGKPEWQVTRTISNLLAFFSAAFPVIVWIFHVRWLGFPDGHLSQFATFEKQLFWPISALLLLCGCGFLYVGLCNDCHNRKRKFVLFLRILISLLLFICLVEVFGPFFYDVGIGG